MFVGYGNCSSVFDCGGYFAFGPLEVMVATNDGSGEMMVLVMPCLGVSIETQKLKREREVPCLDVLIETKKLPSDLFLSKTLNRFLAGVVKCWPAMPSMLVIVAVCVL